MDCIQLGSYVHGIFQAIISEWVVIPSSRDLPDPEFKPTFLHWQADSLPLSHLGSPEDAYYYLNVCQNTD